MAPPPRARERPRAARSKRGRALPRFSALLGVPFALFTLVEGSADGAAPDGNDFKGCGKTKEEARRELARNIFTELKDSFAVAESEDTRDAAASGTSVQSETMVYSHVQLRDLQWPEELKTAERVCAVQSRSALRDDVLAGIERLKNCDPADLPKEDNVRHERIRACAKDLQLVRNLYPLFWSQMMEPERQLASRVGRMEAALMDLDAQIQLQSVRFNVTVDGAVARIGHDPVPIQAKIPWPPGPINYTVEAPGHCTLSGTVELKPEEGERIITIDLSKHKLPRLQFRANHPSAVLELDGRRSTLGEPISFSRCSGSAAYKIYVEGEDDEHGEIALKPGLDRTISVKLLSREARDRLQHLGETFTKASILPGTYAIGSPLSGDIDTNVVHSFAAAYTRAFRALRYGGGLAYGFAGGGDVHMIEGFGRLTGQLTTLGDEPLHLGSSVSLIPYVTADLGFGYHGLTPKTTGRKGDFGNFVESYVIARGTLGLFAALNDQLGISLHAAYLLTMERALFAGAGVLVHLP